MCVCVCVCMPACVRSCMCVSKNVCLETYVVNRVWVAYFPIWACSWWRRLATGMPTSSGSMTCCPSRSRRKTHCQKTGRSSPSSSTSRDTTPTSTKRHTTRKCSMRWGFTVRLGYYSSQHAQARNKKMLIEVGFHSQTGLLLQSACTGTQ